IQPLLFNFNFAEQHYARRLTDRDLQRRLSRRGTRIMVDEERTRFQSQVVERTGLALVHEGERIYPSEDSTATLTPMVNVVNYYFPVEIEIVGEGAADKLAEQIYAALQREFSSLG